MPKERGEAMADENKVLPFRVGPTIDEEMVERAREMFNPQALFDAVVGLTNGRTLAESIAEGIQASIEQLRGEYVFNARAMLAGALADIHAQYPQPSIADAVAGLMRQTQESAGVNRFAPSVAALALAQNIHAQAEIAGRSVHGRTLGNRKDEGCQRKQEPDKVQELGKVG
jgi:hypothetical protein